MSPWSLTEGPVSSPPNMLTGESNCIIGDKPDFPCRLAWQEEAAPRGCRSLCWRAGCGRAVPPSTCPAPESSWVPSPSQDTSEGSALRGHWHTTPSGQWSGAHTQAGLFLPGVWRKPNAGRAPPRVKFKRERSVRSSPQRELAASDH